MAHLKTILEREKQQGKLTPASKVLEELQAAFSDRVSWSKRTMERILKELRAIDQDPQQELLNQRFEWHRLDQYGLPWEAASFLLDVYYEDRSGKGDLFDKTQGIPKKQPTVRDMIWYWRFHQAVPQAAITDVRLWGSFLSTYDFISSGRPPSADEEDALFALQALLAFKPWDSEDRMAEYRRALQEATVPALMDFPGRLGQAFLSRLMSVSISNSIRGFSNPLLKDLVATTLGAAEPGAEGPTDKQIEALEQIWPELQNLCSGPPEELPSFTEIKLIAQSLHATGTPKLSPPTAPGG